jgi:hypothetical protein
MAGNATVTIDCGIQFTRTGYTPERARRVNEAFLILMGAGWTDSEHQRAVTIVKAEIAKGDILAPAHLDRYVKELSG